jgi:polyisoprenoid-binding protein YceI
MSDNQQGSRIFSGALIPLPGLYTLDPVHTFTEFVTQHLVVGHVRGIFDQTTGEVTIADDPTQSTIEVRIETASVSTHNARRDEDLRSPRFFDAEAFPVMGYRSVKVFPELDGLWTVEGELTIRNVTRPVLLTARITGANKDQTSKIRFGLHADARVSRREFGLLADLERESGGMMLGQDVVISVDAEATR